MKSVSMRSMIRCFRTTRSARSIPVSVRIASLCSPRSTSPSASSRRSISPADARETPEHLRDAGGDRRGAVRVGPVLADREGEEVDRLEVLVDRMSLTVRHGVSLAARVAAAPPRPSPSPLDLGVRPVVRTSASSRSRSARSVAVALGSRGRGARRRSPRRSRARRRAGRPPPHAWSGSPTRSGSGRAPARRAPAARRPAATRAAPLPTARRRWRHDSDDDRDDDGSSAPAASQSRRRPDRASR